MKTFPIQIDDNLHKSIKIAALKSDLTLQKWIIGALKKYLKDNGYVGNSNSKKRGK